MLALLSRQALAVVMYGSVRRAGRRYDELALLCGHAAV